MLRRGEEKSVPRHGRNPRCHAGEIRSDRERVKSDIRRDVGAAKRRMKIPLRGARQLPKANARYSSWAREGACGRGGVREGARISIVRHAKAW